MTLAQNAPSTEPVDNGNVMAVKLNIATIAAFQEVYAEIAVKGEKFRYSEFLAAAKEVEKRIIQLMTGERTSGTGGGVRMEDGDILIEATISHLNYLVDRILAKQKEQKNV